MKWNELSTLKSKAMFLLRVIGILLLAHIVVFVIYKTNDNWDSDPDRGALIFKTPGNKANRFKDNYDKIFPGKVFDKEKNKKVDWQGWNASDSMWFYKTSQGSDLIPYDFFMVLEEKGSPKLFRDNERMDNYRYIVLKKTYSNPDGLPLGIVKDVYQGKEFVGFTCAACHTSQINYGGYAMRIDGGPAMADMESFIEDLSAALQETLSNDTKRKRFAKAVMDRNGFTKWICGGRNYTGEKQVIQDLKKYASRLLVYKTINKSRTDEADRHKEVRLKYGYARLDAFGRIFNRTLQHVLTKNNLENILKKYLDKDRRKIVLKELNDKVLPDNEFDHILDRLAPLLKTRELLAISKELFNSPNAPVSYPYMWDASRHDFLQWDGIAANTTVGPLARNTGEVIGVFGTLDWKEKNTITLNSILLGNKTKKILFESSIDKHNLVRLENHLSKLYSPQWPAEVLGPIDQEAAERGGQLFDEYCVSCHNDIDRTRFDRKVVANFRNLQEAGTDQTMAMNALTRVGYSGILNNTYAASPMGDLVVPEKSPVALLFISVTKNVIAIPDPDKWFLRRFYEYIYDFGATFLNNDVKTSLRVGSYTPGTTAAPFNELAAYKARPLNGIWATAPYLHNGSVPTLYDLLLPSRKDVANKKVRPNAEGEYRPDKFMVGSREFDPKKVGFITEGYKGFLFDTSKKGNYNTGHIYKLDQLTRRERLDIVEYLKTL